MKIYTMNHGWATRYLWLDIEKEVFEGFDCIERIKNSTVTFSVYSGTTEADCYGSTSALDFYSRRSIDSLKELTLECFIAHKIIIDFNGGQIFYYIQPTKAYPKIQDEDIFSEPDLRNYCSSNKTDISYIMNVGSKISPCYCDISKWDGSHIFTMQESRFLFVTDKIKEAFERLKLKNIKFQEVKFCTQYL